MGPMGDDNFQSLSLVNLQKACTAKKIWGFAASFPRGRVCCIILYGHKTNFKSEPFFFPAGIVSSSN